MNDISEALRRLVMRHKLSTEDQLAILQTYFEDQKEPTVSHMLAFFSTLDKAYVDQAQQAYSAPAELVPEEPEQTTLQTYITRKFDRKLMDVLQQVPGQVGHPTVAESSEGELEGRTIILHVPDQIVESMRKCLRTPDPEVRPGVIRTGIYATLPHDAAIVAIAVTNASTENSEGPYIDAWIALPDDTPDFPNAPNPSLPPIRTLQEDYVFSYPDGTYRTIRLRVSEPQGCPFETTDEARNNDGA